ncbi:MAG TPA: chemotaxis protein CheA [Clostridia bacterium]|nr:chemotaxis protein CheA [Clostridia bacterium]
MNFFSDDRANELRNIFFESAQELLQALNEEGLELEKHPSDPEAVRNIRRTVHTLKGDSAACGYRELSELAHELEDVLTPELATKAGASLAELVLSAADIFDAMLSAYRGDMQPPAGNSLREMIHRVIAPQSEATAEVFAPSFAWTEYESLLISQHAVRGQNVYNVAIAVDPQCPMRAAALQLIRNVMQEVGTLVVMHPEEGSADVSVEVIELALASHHEQDWIAKKARIPSVVSRVHVEPYANAQAPAPVVEPEVSTDPELATDDLLGILSDAPAQAVPSPLRGGETERTATDKHAAEKQLAAIENILRVDADRIDVVLDLVGELIIGKSMLHQTFTEFGKRFPKDPLRAKFSDAMSFQAQVLNKLQRSVMKIRMVPVEQLFRRFPRVVRDVSKQQNKDVTLVLEGETTDLDKSILDSLAEPMTHLVRNAVDHGIESPEERVALGKPAQGTIRLNAHHQGNQVIIEISDDGRGIDRGKVVAKALERGLLKQEDAARLNEAEALNLIFHAGLSTAEQVTEISGRGVGMDIVKGVMERLKGSVAIHTVLGEGTTFRLKLPLTLAIIKALLFRVADRLYAIPLGSVLEIARASEAEIHIVDNHEVLQLREEVVTLVRLRQLVKAHGATKGKRAFIIVVAMADRKFGLIVDRLVGEEELVIKALDDNLVNTDLVSGASILGDGTVVLILNIAAVVERLGRAAVQSGTARTVGASA